MIRTLFILSSSFEQYNGENKTPLQKIIWFCPISEGGTEGRRENILADGPPGGLCLQP
jgi:hypothetical protein